jgi:hypothetical protein
MRGPKTAQTTKTKRKRRSDVLAYHCVPVSEFHTSHYHAGPALLFGAYWTRRPLTG